MQKWYSNKGLSEKKNHNNNFQTHTGEMPETCEACRKGFLQTGKLKYHLQTHTDENLHIYDVHAT